MRKLPLAGLLVSITVMFCLSAAGQNLSPAEKQERIKKAMPAPLPQTPVVPKASSDAADMGLKGRVKEVIESHGHEGDSQLVSDYIFDKTGARVTEVSYDYNGNPWLVTVFGYIDGKRVSNDTTIKYDYDPPPPMPRPGAKPAAEPRDTRYRAYYEYAYGPNGRLVESRSFSNSGKPYGRTVYVATGTTVEKTQYDNDGKIVGQSTEIYDSHGDLTEARYPAANGYGASENHYTYEKYDKQGNWTRRVVSGKVGRWKGLQQDFKRVEERVITYY